MYLSDDAFRQVRGKTSLAFDDLGERLLKNIDRPVRLYAVRSASFSPETAAIASTEADKPLPLPDKPSIAVLPFQNMSSDPEQEYFADGMVEEIITALSRFKSLFVIARNSSFAYKGKSQTFVRSGVNLECVTCSKEAFAKRQIECASRDSSSIPPLGPIFGRNGLMVGSATSSICRTR